MLHPESSTGSLGNAAMKASGEEKDSGMTEEVQKEETEYVEEKDVGKKGEKDTGKKMDNLSSLLKSAPQINEGADSSTRKCFIDLTKIMTKTNTFREHRQRAILETCEL